MASADRPAPDPRSGQRRSRALEVERRSIDYVPLAERHGRVWQQGLFWFLGNFQFFTVALGFVGIGLGLSVLETAVAGGLGILFGTLFMAFHATQGPHLGLPQMIQSRAQLGYSGVVVALAGSFATYMLFNVVDVLLLGGGLGGIFGWDITLVGIAVTVAAAALAIYGHDLLHRAFQVLFVLSVPVYAALTLAIVFGALDAAPAAPPADGAGWPELLAMFTLGTAYNITYAPYVSDYSRYLPRTTRTAPLVLAVFVGASASAIWLIALGAWLASSLGASDALVGLNEAGGRLAPWLGAALVLLSVAAGVATMGINAYGAMLSAITAIDSIRRVRATRGLRVATIAALAVAWCVAALAIGGDALGAAFNALVVMLFLLVPWTAINLVDYFFVRRGRYAILDLFDPSGIYGRWGRRGLLAFVAGLVSMAPFFVVPGVYAGPAATGLGGADISSLVGLSVAGGTYYLLTRSLDVAAERPAIEASRRALEVGAAGTGATDGGGQVWLEASGRDRQGVTSEP